MDFATALRRAESKPSHAERVAAYNAELKRHAGIGYQVIETATGRAVGDGQAMAHAFAQHVCDVRDAFKTGEFVIQEISKHRAKAA